MLYCFHSNSLKALGEGGKLLVHHTVLRCKHCGFTVYSDGKTGVPLHAPIVRNIQNAIRVNVRQRKTGKTLN